MDREHVHSEIRALIAQSATAPDVERLSDEITTSVMAAALPGEVREIDSIEALPTGYACNFQRRMQSFNPKFERAAFFNTEPARVLIPRDVAHALAALAA